MYYVYTTQSNSILTYILYKLILIGKILTKYRLFIFKNSGALLAVIPGVLT